ncbi:hypothetical protein [Bacillus ndiopicus]|uniref:hypothetical protein n=1 Tax=Bacillus ndiopicus TaxID=1347368 RepID=UPI0005A9F108|nr:hypothetical protein [Bacillus ndiopicus]
MNKLLIEQNYLLSSIKSEIKEIRLLSKRAIKKVKETGPKESIAGVKDGINFLNKGLKTIEKEIFRWRFKNATFESIDGLKEILHCLKDEKAKFIIAYNDVINT